MFLKCIKFAQRRISRLSKARTACQVWEPYAYHEDTQNDTSKKKGRQTLHWDSEARLATNWNDFWLSSYLLHFFVFLSSSSAKCKTRDNSTRPNISSYWSLKIRNRHNWNSSVTSINEMWCPWIREMLGRVSVWKSVQCNGEQSFL